MALVDLVYKDNSFQATDLNQSILQLEVTQKQLVTQTANNSALLKEVESKLQE